MATPEQTPKGSISNGRPPVGTTIRLVDLTGDVEPLLVTHDTTDDELAEWNSRSHGYPYDDTHDPTVRMAMRDHIRAVLQGTHDATWPAFGIRVEFPDEQIAAAKATADRDAHAARAAYDDLTLTWTAHDDGVRIPEWTADGPEGTSAVIYHDDDDYETITIWGPDKRERRSSHDTLEEAQAFALSRLRELLGDRAYFEAYATSEYQRLSDARYELAVATAAAKRKAVALVKGGTSEAEAARLVGLDRMTVRKALGKR